MKSYIFPIKTAIIFFPILAFLITLPYMFIEYRKYGSINKLRTLIIYSFVLYLTVAYFLIILPLPTFEEVANLKTQRMQLIPFTFIKDFINHTSLIMTDSSTYLKALKEPYVYQVLYNLILLLPLGIYLRYYYKCSFKKTILISFLVSLFFELTQLTGLYFIYPRGYRLFDVDDLIINTLGGILGYLITPLFTFFLPSRERIDEKSYLKGRKVSFLRRTFAFIIDQLVVLIIYLTLPIFNNKILFVYFVYYMIIPMITKGKTLGKMLLRLRITDINGEECKWYQCLFRYSLQYLFIYATPIFFMWVITVVHEKNNYIILLLTILLFIIYIGYIFIKICMNLFAGKLFTYENLSKTINSSTIKTHELEDKFENEHEDDDN